MYTSRYLRLMSSREFVIGAAVLVAIGVAAALFYDFGLYTPAILRRGSITVASRKDPTNRLTAATRLIAIRRQFWQVEFPVGVWNDCHQSCGETLRKAAFNEQQVFSLRELLPDLPPLCAAAAHLLALASKFKPPRRARG